MAEEKTMSIEQEIIDIIVDKLQLDPSEVSPEKSFVEDLNADSLDLTELMMTFEDRFDFDIPDEDTEKLVTVGAVIEYVKAQSADA